MSAPRVREFGFSEPGTSGGIVARTKVMGIMVLRVTRLNHFREISQQSFMSSMLSRILFDFEGQTGRFLIFVSQDSLGS